MKYLQWKKRERNLFHVNWSILAYAYKIIYSFIASIDSTIFGNKIICTVNNNCCNLIIYTVLDSFFPSRNDGILPFLYAKFKAEGKLSDYMEELKRLTKLKYKNFEEVNSFKAVVPLLSMDDFDDGVAEVITVSYIKNYFTFSVFCSNI